MIHRYQQLHEAVLGIRSIEETSLYDLLKFMLTPEFLFERPYSGRVVPMQSSPRGWMYYCSSPDKSEREIMTSFYGVMRYLSLREGFDISHLDHDRAVVATFGRALVRRTRTNTLIEHCRNAFYSLSMRNYQQYEDNARGVALMIAFGLTDVQDWILGLNIHSSLGPYTPLLEMLMLYKASPGTTFRQTVDEFTLQLLNYVVAEQHSSPTNTVH